MRSLRAMVLLAAAVPPASSAQAAAQGDAPIPVYRCQMDGRLSEGAPGNLRVYKSFREDGAVNNFRVVWEDNAGGLVQLRQPNDHAFVTLQWPGEHRLFPDGAPWDWSQGSITIGFVAADAAVRAQPRRGEEWRQTFVDRNQSAGTYIQAGDTFLMPALLDLNLAGDLEPNNSSARLDMSLDSLLAWGSRSAHLTVYDTLVTRRRPTPNTYPTSPAGARRIVGVYDLDAAEIERVTARIRAATQSWEEGLRSSWRQCARTTEGGAITVGPNRIRRPDLGAKAAR